MTCHLIGAGCGFALLALLTKVSKVHAEPLYLAALAVVAFAASWAFSYAG